VIEVGDASQNGVGRFEVVVDCTRTVSVEDAASTTFELGQNQPNPFTPQTTIQFALAFPVHVSLKVYDVSGAEVATLIDGDMRSGLHSVQWNAPGAGVRCRRAENGPDFSGGSALSAGPLAPRTTAPWERPLPYRDRLRTPAS
jgi:hypothetical protein